MSAPQFLPWQLETARNWLGNRERFAHAWLVHGLAGIGKLDFAVAAASLLCETPQDGLACGHCALRLVRQRQPSRPAPHSSRSHRGGRGRRGRRTGRGRRAVAGSASKRAPSKEIRIDQIRALESWFNTATTGAAGACCCIRPTR